MYFYLYDIHNTAFRQSLIVQVPTTTSWLSSICVTKSNAQHYDKPHAQFNFDVKNSAWSCMNCEIHVHSTYLVIRVTNNKIPIN